MAGSKEDGETVSAFFQDMRARGLGDPLLVASDGAPGIIKASPAHPTTGPMLRYLEDLESGATPHERPPWARPGWIAGVKGWITEPLAMRANPCASTHRT
jgi:hypothetical protein